MATSLSTATRALLLAAVLSCASAATLSAAVPESFSLGRLQTLIKDGRVEAVYNLMHAALEQGELQASQLHTYYYVALWLSLGMQDHRRALTLVQIGIDRARELERTGVKDAMFPGDHGVFLARCTLLRAKAQILARMGRFDDARAASEECTGALLTSFKDPKDSGIWTSPMHLGQTILFSHSAVPVIRSAYELKGPEEAARQLEWVTKTLDAADIILGGMAARPGMPADQVTNNRRILAWARAEALLYGGKPDQALEVMEPWPPEPGASLEGKGFFGYPLIVRAQALARTGKREAAYRDLGLARAVFEAARNNIWTGPNLWMADYHRGKLLEEDGKVDDAATAYARSIADLRPLYDKIQSAYARREFLKESDQVYQRLVRLLLAQGKTDQALDRLEESHSKGLLDLMEDTLNDSRRGWSEDLKARARTIKQKLSDLEASPAAPAASPAAPGKARTVVTPDRQRVQRFELLAEYERLLHTARTAAPAAPASPSAAAPGRAASPARWKAALAGKTDARARLVANDRFRTVIFLVGADPCWVTVCGGGKSQAFRLTATSREIRKTARQLRKAITGHSDGWPALAKDLHRMVLEPAAPALAGASKLLIVPDGELWYVPFACLLRADGSALAESFDIGVLSNLSLAAVLLDWPAVTAAPALRVFADPDGSLPNARKEGEAIAALGGKASELHVGPEATERRLKGDGATTPRIVHLATHGVLDSVNPLYSYLLLSPGGGEDGRLQISEVSSELNLRGTPLAVLSACNSAVGEVAGGNEMVCLQQSFHEAGVPVIVASLWEVSDEWTAALMQAFYRELFAGATPATALARSMRGLAAGKAATPGTAATPATKGAQATPAAAYQEPYRWSAFQVYGLP